MSNKADRIRGIAERLNTERASAEMGFKRRGGRIVGFTPCAKSLFYLAALCAPGECRPPALEAPGLATIDTTTPTLLLHAWAAGTPCECHNSLTAQGLLDYEFPKSNGHEEKSGAV